MMKWCEWGRTIQLKAQKVSPVGYAELTQKDKMKSPERAVSLYCGIFWFFPHPTPRFTSISLDLGHSLYDK